MIELEGVSRRFDGVAALKDIDLKVNGGGVHVVVGRSGAGKTTLIRILAMLLEPSGGRVLYDGAAVNDQEREALRGRFTMVFQRTVLFNSTVYGNVAYGLKLRGLSRKEIAEKMEAVLGPVGLAGLEGRHAYRLSVGQQQRVSLARALVLEPEVLLMDEPTANLDPENTAVIERMIVEFAGRGTVVLSTHNVAQALRLADRVVFLEDGLLVEEGGREILERPSGRRLRRFVQGEPERLLDIV